MYWFKSQKRFFDEFLFQITKKLNLSINWLIYKLWKNLLIGKIERIWRRMMYSTLRHPHHETHPRWFILNKGFLNFWYLLNAWKIGSNECVKWGKLIWKLEEKKYRGTQDLSYYQNEKISVVTLWFQML